MSVTSNGELIFIPERLYLHKPADAQIHENTHLQKSNYSRGNMARCTLMEKWCLGMAPAIEKILNIYHQVPY